MQAGFERAAALGVTLPGTNPVGTHPVGLNQPGTNLSGTAAQSELQGAELQQALIGHWGNPRMRLDLEFRADGIVVNSAAGRRDEKPWRVTGPGEILFGVVTMRVTMNADRLTLTEPGGVGISVDRS